MLDALVQAGVPLTGACWLRPDNEPWFLYLCTPLVDEKGGTGATYGRVLGVLRDLNPIFFVDPLEIKVVSPRSAVARAIDALHERYPGVGAIPHEGGRFGDVYAEAGYIYPPISAAVS